MCLVYPGFLNSWVLSFWLVLSCPSIRKPQYPKWLGSLRITGKFAMFRSPGAFWKGCNRDVFTLPGWSEGTCWKCCRIHKNQRKPRKFIENPWRSSYEDGVSPWLQPQPSFPQRPQQRRIGHQLCRSSGACPSNKSGPNPWSFWGLLTWWPGVVVSLRHVPLVGTVDKKQFYQSS